MNYVIWWSFASVAASAAAAAEKWQWPEQASRAAVPAHSVRIDTKVRFIDGQDHEDREQGRGQGGRVQADEVPFLEAADTDGFYNRPGGAGRYPVRVESHPYSVDQHAIYSLHTSPKNSDGTLDSLQYCKCTTTPDCNPRHDSTRACGSGKFLCCYKRPNKVTPLNSEYFNEIDDERPSLLPGREEFARPFPPPPSHAGGFEGAGVFELDPARRSGSVLVGPGGPAGNVGSTGLLVGPGGPSGVIGPDARRGSTRHPDVLVGPEGPTNVIGPAPIHYKKGAIGSEGPRDARPTESAQRGILVGPGGPTGVIGPRGYGMQRQVLVGPGGPTGIIGPRMRGYFNQFFTRQQGPGVLAGPGGPTGMIGPARQLLVGPGGPTGRIGPLNYFGSK